MRNRLISNLFDVMQKDCNSILLTGDLGFGVLDKIINTMPVQYINAGVAEQNMMSIASGLCHSGKSVFVYSIGNFNTLRCVEQIRNDCCYHNKNVKIICIGAGFAYGALGMSHHATEDLAIMRALPNMTIFSPASKYEVDILTPYLSQDIGTCYMRLGKGGEREIHSKTISNYSIGDPIILDSDGDVLLLVTGAIASETLEAKERLASFGIKVAMATMPVIKPINEDKICELLQKYNKVVTIEEHSTTGGFGGMIAEIIATKGILTKLSIMGIDNQYSSIVGDRLYLMEKYGIGTSAIVDKVKSLQ